MPTSTSCNVEIWHRRLGQISEKGLSECGLISGECTINLGVCEHCIYGKKTKVKFGTKRNNTKHILEYIYL